MDVQIIKLLCDTDRHYLLTGLTTMLLIIVMSIAAPKLMNKIPNKIIIETVNMVSMKRCCCNTDTLRAASDLSEPILTKILEEPFDENY